MSTFPGGTAVTVLDVYGDAAPDGLTGGSPHMHLVSTEAYVVVAGSGSLHTIDGTGFSTTPLTPGTVAWFTPGTIHRAVNFGGLRILVVMSNAGLPEAGDAVLTLPEEYLTDRDVYQSAATIRGEDEGERMVSAAERRNLAVEGYLPLARAAQNGDVGPFQAFKENAAALVSPLALNFGRIISGGPAALAEQSLAAVEALSAGSTAGLNGARVELALNYDGPRELGMCGRLLQYDIGGAE